MTTTQRNALTSVAEGDEIWNTTSKRKEVYNGTSWEDAGGRTGEIVDFAGASLPAYMLLCDGSAVSRTTYAALFAKLSTTWGVGDGSTTFNLPDLRRRTTIGSGGTAIAGPANTLASTGGHENYQSHSHGAGSYSTNSAGSHGHSISDPGHTHTESGYNTNGALGHANIGGSLGGVSTTFSATTGISINADGSHSHSITGGNSASSGSGNAENMQPCAVVHKCVVI
jgi:microcystin-dependent protein